MLTLDERRRVEDAVRLAEAGTAGEIVVVMARQAASYRSVPLAYALAGAALTPPFLVALTQLPTIRIFAAQLLVALVLLVATAPTTLRPRLVPDAVRRMRGREAAAREFERRGMADTRGRTGVLLYVAHAERYAEVVGDVTIAAKVDEAEWRAIVTALVAALDQGRAADGLIAAVGGIGAILARHVPAGSGDQDELPNRVVLI